MDTPIHILGEAFTLPAPSDDTARRDLLSRIARRLTLETSSLRNIGGSLDWRLSATYALDQVRQARVGVVPMATYYPGELAPAHFTPALLARLRRLLGKKNGFPLVLRQLFERGQCLKPVEARWLRTVLHGTPETQPDADRADDAAIAFAKEAA
jgi:hypothetical protein